MKEAIPCTCEHCGDTHYNTKPRRGFVKLNGSEYYHDKLVPLEGQPVSLTSPRKDAVGVFLFDGKKICSAKRRANRQ